MLRTFFSVFFRSFRWAWVLVVVVLGVVSGYVLTVVDVVRLLPGGEVFRVLSLGLTVGWPVSVFLWAMAGPVLGAMVAGFWVLGGSERSLGGFVLTPLRRVMAVQLPLLASVFVLSQDDLTRRGVFLALLLGVGACLAVYWGVSVPCGESVVNKVEGPWWRRSVVHAPVLAAMVVHVVMFSFLTVRRDRALWSATVDLGIFKEALWNTLHGRPLHSATVGYSFLGEHFSPVLFLLVPLYALWPSSETLLVVQAGAISLSAWPVYRLGLVNGLGRGLSTVLATSMIFAPAMQSSMMYDFHMDLLGVPAWAWAILAAHERRWGVLSVAAAFLCSVKEEAFVPLVGLALAMYFGDPARRKLPAVLLGGGAVLYCVLAIVVLMKHFGPPPGVPVYMGGVGATNETYKFLRNFAHLGGHPAGPVGALLTRPLQFVLWMFTEGRFTTLCALWTPVLFAPLLAGPRMFLMTPLGMLLLSDNPEITVLSYHYGAMQHPGVYAAGIYGMGVLLACVGERNGAQLRRALAMGVAVATVVLLGLHPRSVLSDSYSHDQQHVTEHVRAFDRLVARIPSDAAVSASSFGGPRLSNRREIDLFPRGLDRARFALVDLQRPAWPTSVAARDEAILGMLRSGQWGAVAWESGVVLLERGASTERNRDTVEELFLRRSWEVEGTETTDFPARVERDPTASEGYARVVRPTDRRPAGWVHYGPYVYLPSGEYRVTFRLRAEPTAFGNDAIGVVDVFSGGVILASHRLTPEDFPDESWKDISLEFEGGRGGMEFRIRTDKRWVLWADRISIEPFDAERGLRELGF